ncbi:hypothetical protein BDR06DRAFT_977928 [Suillus hirtellus]|nr:hypothetical protein BDR06DRAFT_977928 [Suillus hirtellus]
MSASQLANAALDAAMEDIQHLIVGHPNAIVFVHNITKIIQPDQSSPPPTIVALSEPLVITFPSATMAPSPIPSLVLMDMSDPAGAAVPKFTLFVAGTKCKAKRLANDDREDIPVPKLKPKGVKTDPKPWEDIARLSKRRKIVMSKILVSDDNAVIIVKKPGTSALAVKSVLARHVAPGPSASTSSTPKDWSDDNAVATTEWPSQYLHSLTCF